MYDVAIIGCGIIGAATAYALAQRNVSVLVLEAENDVANGTTKANSAILHAGYDPTPGTQMARLNVAGSAMGKKLCALLDVPYRQNGSMVVAFSAAELPHLQTLYENGIANGVPDIRLLSGEEARAMEPNLSKTILGALYAPSAAIVNPWEYALALAQAAVQNGVTLKLRSRVAAIDKTSVGYRLHCASTAYDARFIVNAAGIYAAEVHEMVAPPSFTMQPSRGQYHLLDKTEGARVSCTIFQCPTAAGKGVLVAPTVHGNLIVGPDATNVEGENTATTADGLAFVAETAKKSVPSIDFRACIRNFAGVRATTDRADFILEEAKGAPGFINLAGIKSPGLSAAPAIAEEAVRLLECAGLVCLKKQYFTAMRQVTQFGSLTASEKQRLIAENPAYGRVICRCETITEGEILAALAAPIPPCSIDGVKRRCGAGMGRCQGGFCGPRVLDLLAHTLHADPTEILQDKDGTFLLTEETKGGVADG